LVSVTDDLTEDQDITLQDALRSFEKQYILRILKKYKGDKVQAAKELGVGVSTLYRKISELEMNMDIESLGIS
jgi:transcriptional regulator with PAS, ATPase and Fis domain